MLTFEVANKETSKILKTQKDFEIVSDLSLEIYGHLWPIMNTSRDCLLRFSTNVTAWTLTSGCWLNTRQTSPSLKITIKSL